MAISVDELTYWALRAAYARELQAAPAEPIKDELLGFVKLSQRQPPPAQRQIPAMPLRALTHSQLGQAPLIEFEPEPR